MKRNGGLDYFRITCIILIIMGHIQSETFIKSLSISENVIDYLFQLIFGNAERLAINGFLMVSSWFLYGRRFDGKRFFSTWFMVFILNLVITVSTFLFGGVEFSVVLMIQSLLPIIGRPQWYMCEYLLLLLSMPFINKLTVNLDRRSSRLLVGLLFFFIIIVDTIIPINYTYPVFSEYVWFIFIYCLIGHIKTYEKFSINNKCWLLMAFLSYGFIILLIFTGDYLTGTGNGLGTTLKSLGNYYSSHYEALPAFLCSFSLFFYFKGKNCEASRLFSYIAKSTGVIYIIHSVPVFYRYSDYRLWENVFHISYWYKNGLLPFAMIVITVMLILIGTIGFYFYDRILFNYLYKKMNVDKVGASLDKLMNF